MGEGVLKTNNTAYTLLQYPNLGYCRSLLAENNMHSVRGVRTLNTAFGGRCWSGVKNFRGDGVEYTLTAGFCCISH